MAFTSILHDCKHLIIFHSKLFFNGPDFQILLEITGTAILTFHEIFTWHLEIQYTKKNIHDFQCITANVSMGRS